MRSPILLSVLSLGLFAALASAADKAHAADPVDAGPDQKLLTITVPVPKGHRQDPGEAGAVAGLLKQGWRIGQCINLGKTADGDAFVLALIMDREPPMDHAQAAPGGAGEGTSASGPVPPAASPPRTAAPQKGKAAQPGDYRVAWDDGNETRITIERPTGGNNPATVTTRGPDGELLVTYPATAFVDDRGALHVDGHGSTLTGPAADSYSPDSFVIQRNGSVSIIDDQDNVSRGRLMGQGQRDQPGRRGPAQRDEPTSGQTDL